MIIGQPSSMIFKSQDPKLLKRFQSLAQQRIQSDRFFKFFGVVELDLWSGLSASSTEHGMRQICLFYGLDFCNCYRALMAYDIVGPRGKGKIEDHRTAGVLFRYFETHQDRLAEFQSRLDAAKRRRNVTR